ncbi:MAG: YraN family protein [Bacteroidales bacterium]|nr:YraN family protein [Bacteroidales bacterium]
MAAHNELGKLGEDIAAKRLVSEGYEILERQWRYNHKEIDIIAKKGNVLAIVEVKTRSSEQFGGVSDFITPNKTKFLIEAADAYARQSNTSCEIRFDAIVIYVICDEYKVEHIENVFISQ